MRDGGTGLDRVDRGAAGCRLWPAGRPVSTASSLAGRTFLSTSVIEDGKDRPLFAGTTIVASAGCNRLGGNVSFEGSRLIVTLTGTTLMGCDAARRDQDTWLADLLTSGPAWSEANGELRLSTGAVIVSLTDQR